MATRLVVNDNTFSRLWVGDTAPPTGATNDLWFDTTVSEWKRYNGSSWAVPTAVGNVATKTTGTYTLDSTYGTVICNCAGGAITLNLPAASTVTGVVFTIKKSDSTGNAVTVTPNGADTIDGQTSQVISNQYVSMTIQSDGTNWQIV